MTHTWMSKLSMAVMAVAFAVSASAMSASVSAQDDERERGKPKKSCTSHRTETPYRNYGYDHVVIVANRCDHVEHCVIEASSVSGKEELDVPAQSERSVTVRRGSPAREFTAKVTCNKK